MPPGGHLYNIWEQEGVVDDIIDVSCLLPTGILILLRCSREQTITTIKTEVWKQAKKFPFFNQLLDINYYVFQCINQNAEQEELLDEKRRLCDVQPFSPDLKLVLKADDVEDKVLNGNISHLIDKGLHEFDMMHNDEVNDFRMKMQHKSDSIHKERLKWSWEEKACFVFPPRVESSLSLTGTLKKKVDARLPIHIEVKFMDNPLRNTVIKAHLQDVPSDLVRNAFAAVRLLREKNADDYVLKLRGRQDFLIGNRPLYEYKYIRDILAQGSSQGNRPEVIVVHKETMHVNELIMDPLLKRKRDIRPPPTPIKVFPNASHSWDCHEKVRITILKAFNVNVDSSSNIVVRVRAAIFHGGEQLGDSFVTSRETSGSNPTWNEWFDGNITVSNLPRMARLCLLIGTTRKNTTKNFVPLAWVNTTFFDFKHQLQTGNRTLHMWPALEGDEFKALGTVESNPGHRADYKSAAIEISFDNNSQNEKVLYPPIEVILKRAKEIEESEHAVYLDVHASDHTDDLRKIVEKDPLEKLSMQEMDVMWKAREECREHIPHSLPRLLQCVQWDNNDSVAQMQALLKNWPELKPEEAMELLDYKYADQNVRKFAVICLEKLSDEELSQYLLQLVQALKYETYLDCDLGNFLLSRAVQNQRIGHFFFWHLRAEMHNLSSSTRFGLLLEAYCKCNIAHMRILKKQVDNLNRMTSVNEVIKRIGEDKKDERNETMKEMFRQYTFADSFKEFFSPLSPTYHLREPRIDKCKVMGSKMAPLFLVFKNEDPLGDDVRILYKNGDDLRQDMLTLQVLRFMDNIWKKEGLDLRLIPYRAIATGDHAGFIQIVTQSATICNIQVTRAHSRGKTKLGAAFHSSSLYEWLKEKNITDKELDRAIDDFTHSCAGYCVATYVLGIGDRHNDNIMVKETGQLFHIDFGHFLGQFKSKFGVKRERVPFVLTHDFVHVITRGDKRSNTSSKKAFKIFQDLCEQAFLILRRYGNLLITLFAMMLSSGIPELSDSTIGYLRGSLVLDMTEEEAVKHFRSKFKEALQESWKTSVNWSFHNIAKGKAKEKQSQSQK